MSYNSKYSGAQVEELLDRVANGNTGGGGSGGITEETDPVFTASPAASITDEQITGWEGKQDAIADLDDIRAGAAKGATALQSYTEQYKGTVTGVKMNGETKTPSSGVVDIGTVITEHQDLSGKQDKLVSGTNIKTVNGESILGSGNIEISGGGSASGAYLPLTGGTLTGPVVFKNGGRISVDSDDNLNVSIDETLYIDNDVRSTYGSVTLEEGVFEYANAEGGYTKATGVAFKSVTSMSDTVTLRDDIFYDFTAAVNGDVSFVLGTAMGSGHYMFRIYVPSGYSIALPATLYFFGDEPTEAGCVYEVSIYRGVTVCVKIGQKNVMGGQ